MLHRACHHHLTSGGHNPECAAQEMQWQSGLQCQTQPCQGLACLQHDGRQVFLLACTWK